MYADSANQSLALMDGNFNTIHQLSNHSFATGQNNSTMTTIVINVTAIQLIQDQMGYGDGRYPDGLLAVFGVGEENATETYLGFAHVPLAGVPGVLPATPTLGQFAVSLTVDCIFSSFFYQAINRIIKCVLWFFSGFLNRNR